MADAAVLRGAASDRHGPPETSIGGNSRNALVQFPAARPRRSMLFLGAGGRRLGEVALAQGEVEEAMRWLEAAIATLRASGRREAVCGSDAGQPLSWPVFSPCVVRATVASVHSPTFVPRAAPSSQEKR